MDRRDGWSKAEIVFSSLAGLGGIAVPVVLAYFGMVISQKQEALTELHRQTERLDSIVEKLASENARMRRMATQVA